MPPRDEPLTTIARDWDRHVEQAEEIARGDGFRALRDRILAAAEPRPGDEVADLGSGTGLLTLALAPDVKRVWAIDISPSMGEYLETKAASAGHDNVRVGTASVVSLPLVDASVDLVVSNYCLHHLSDADKLRALAEVHRVLRPGGRFVFGDMMFAIGVSDPRDRAVVASKVRALLAKGPAGVVRLARNGARYAAGRWEQPARSEWWRLALTRVGFEAVSVEVLDHEGGLATARRP